MHGIPVLMRGRLSESTVEIKVFDLSIYLISDYIYHLRYATYPVTATILVQPPLLSFPLTLVPTPKLITSRTLLIIPLGDPPPSIIIPLPNRSLSSEPKYCPSIGNLSSRARQWPVVRCLLRMIWQHSMVRLLKPDTNGMKRDPKWTSTADPLQISSAL